MSLGTRGKRVGEHRRDRRERTPEPSFTEKISRAVTRAGESIKESISSPEPTKTFQANRAERESLSQPLPPHSPKSTRGLKSAPLYSEEEAAQKIREELAGDVTGKEPEPVRRLTSSERRELRMREREDKKRAWAESADNANNRKAKDGIGKAITGKIAEFGKDLRGDVGRVISGGEEPEPTDEEDTESKETSKDKIKLYGSGDVYRRDDEGTLYVRDEGTGKWISTGKKSKYGKPKLVDSESREKTTSERGSKERPSLDRGDRFREPKIKASGFKGILSTGALGEKRARGSGYDEDAELERMASFKKQGSALHVGSGYITSGTYTGSGYDERREKERIEKIGQAGSPLSAGLGYISAGTYRAKPKAQDETGKLDIKSSDVYSTGQFKMHYGGKKSAKPVDTEDQINAEMAKLAALQARQSQLTQLQQIQAMQRQLQPELPGTTAITPIAEPENDENKSALEFIFGIKPSISTKKTIGKSPINEGSATAQLFGIHMKTTTAPKKSAVGNATAEFFGVKYGIAKPVVKPTIKPKQNELTVVGEFGKKRTTRPKSNMSLTSYKPKNKLPETNGGFMGLFEKTKKGKAPNQQKKLHATASEFLFSKK